jgi:hypothetical protein
MSQVEICSAFYVIGTQWIRVLFGYSRRLVEHGLNMTVVGLGTKLGEE